MTDFLSKLFSISKESDDLADPGLMQGARFNKMQQQIEQPVYSHLPLMEQTTGAGLGSIKEPLENNSQLHSLDKKELEKLAKLENKYEELIDQLRKLQTKTRGSHKIDELQGKIKALNVKIMQQARKLINQTYKTHLTVDKINPCPIPRLIVSPSYQFSPKIRFFHLCEGKNPFSSPGRSIPLFVP